LYFQQVLLATAIATMPACQPRLRVQSSSIAPHVIEVGQTSCSGSAGDAGQSTCRTWHLGEPEAERFFRLSKRYEHNPYSAFYQTDCSIAGKLQVEGRLWKFQIDGGGTASWTDGPEIRYWGCSDRQCEPLMLIATDRMDLEWETRLEMQRHLPVLKPRA